MDEEMRNEFKGIRNEFEGMRNTFKGMRDEFEKLTNIVEFNTHELHELKEQVGINCKKLDKMSNDISEIKHQLSHFVK